MKYPLILTAAAVLTTSPLFAAPHEGSAFIHDYDSDHDGSVTAREFDTVRAARFKATDANGDGWVSEAEYVSEYGARLETQLAQSDQTEDRKAEERQRQIRQTHVRFGVLDTDKDGRMQQAEYDASGARAFAQQDHDKDGIVTAADVKITAARHAAAMAKRDK